MSGRPPHLRRASVGAEGGGLTVGISQALALAASERGCRRRRVHASQQQTANAPALAGQAMVMCHI